jgi:hypothetical protein
MPVFYRETAVEKWLLSLEIDPGKPAKRTRRRAPAPLVAAE